jgi:hypothetical protein
VAPCGWVISSRSFEETCYVHRQCNVWLHGITTMKIEYTSLKLWEGISQTHDATTQKTCFLNRYTCLQLIKYSCAVISSGWSGNFLAALAYLSMQYSFFWQAQTQSVEVLRHEPESRGFDSRCCLWYFSLAQSFRPHCVPGFDSACNTNEYQEYFLEGVWRRPVRRADNLTTFMCRLSRNLGASNSWKPRGL